MILIDTNVIFGLSTSSPEKYRDAINQLIAGETDQYLIAPTPVCFELAKWHRWQKVKTDDVMFRYAKFSIQADIHLLAANYLLKAGENVGKPEQKQQISDMDAMIAAYALRDNSKIITCNQSDFPPLFFDCQKIACMEFDKKRDLLFLLSPKPNWQKLLS